MGVRQGHRVVCGCVAASRQLTGAPSPSPRYYQVLVMIFKFVLCIPVVVFWNRILVQTLVTLLLLVMYAPALSSAG